MGCVVVVLGRGGLNVDRGFLNRNVLFTHPRHAQNPGPVDRPGDAGGDAGKNTGKQGLVERLARGIAVHQCFDQKNARAAGEECRGANERRPREQRDGVCAKEGVVHQKHPEAAQLVQK